MSRKIKRSSNLPINPKINLWTPQLFLYSLTYYYVVGGEAKYDGSFQSTIVRMIEVGSLTKIKIVLGIIINTYTWIKIVKVKVVLQTLNSFQLKKEANLFKLNNKQMIELCWSDASKGQQLATLQMTPGYFTVAGCGDNKVLRYVLITPVTVLSCTWQLHPLPWSEGRSGRPPGAHQTHDQLQNSHIHDRCEV